MNARRRNKMGSFARLFAATVALAASVAVANDATLEAERRVTLEADRCATLYHSYEFEDIKDTPAPGGLVPFYISHYGRHGSRHLLEADDKEVLARLEKENGKGNLAPAGIRLLDAMRRLAAQHDDMYGELALRGATEHETLARRMAERFPQVFAGDGKSVVCQGSRIARCNVSMAAFVSTLSRVFPRISFTFLVGRRYHSILVYRPSGWKENDRPRMGKLMRKTLRSEFDSKRFLSSIFVKPPRIKDPALFVLKVFDCASIAQCLDRELDGLSFMDVFTSDERTTLARCRSIEYYAALGGSLEFGDTVLASAKPVVADILKRADAAVAGRGVAADLRFAHDSGLWPIAPFLKLAGPGDRIPATETFERCPVWKYCPMAANLQIVLYRTPAPNDVPDAPPDPSKVLVKILWNEKETAVRGLTPVAGPYYAWSDFRAGVEKALAE